MKKTCFFQENNKVPVIPIVHFRDAKPPFVICVKIVSSITFSSKLLPIVLWFFQGAIQLRGGLSNKGPLPLRAQFEGNIDHLCHFVLYLLQYLITYQDCL